MSPSGRVESGRPGVGRDTDGDGPLGPGKRRRLAMARAARREELLDGPLDDAEVLRGNLRDLRRINRLLGGTALSARALSRLLETTAVTVTAVRLLDVGTGAADIPLALLRRARRSQLPLSIVAVDARPEVLDAARAVDTALTLPGAPELAVADGRHLPWPAASFDVAHASLVLHHLEPRDAVAFLSELRRVSRHGVIVNDLVRSRAAWALAILGARLLTRNPLTRNDAPLSVRRAYTLPEVRELLRAAGLRPVHVGVGVMRHRFAIAAVPVDALTGAARAPERP